MKTLYIARHAKSSWDFPLLSDEERPLMEKGKKNTIKAAEFLLQKQVKIDVIISSHAVRALETAKIFAQVLQYPQDQIIIAEQVYHASGEDLTDVLFELDDRYTSAMIVGHNPTMTDYLNRFLKQPVENFKTSGVACISFDTDQWAKIPLAKHKVNFITFV